MTKRKPEEVARTGVEQLDRLIQEAEELRAENEDLKKRLEVAKEILKPKWKECEKIMAVFGDSPVMESSPQNGDPLLRFRPLLEKTSREANRKVAQAIADMGGRATIKQLVAATGYTRRTGENAVYWLRGHQVVRKDGKEAVIEK